MSKYPLVLSTLATISVKTENMDFTQNSLIAVTAAGVIQGTYVSEVLQETLKEDIDYLTFSNIHTLAKEEYHDTSDAVLLKNVILTTGQGIKLHFNFLYLFVEDIIALSFGNCSDDN